MWSAHLPALLELLAQTEQAPLPAQAVESLRYSLHGTDQEAGQWVEYPFSPTTALRARLALDPEDRDIMHLDLSLPPALCEKIELLSLEPPFC